MLLCTMDFAAEERRCHMTADCMRVKVLDLAGIRTIPDIVLWFIIPLRSLVSRYNHLPLYFHGVRLPI